MANGQTDLDKLVGGEPHDAVPWEHDGARERPDKVAPDDLMPEKAMPFKQTPKPFTIKGA